MPHSDADSDTDCDCQVCINFAVLQIIDVVARFKDPIVAVGALLTAIGFTASIMTDGTLEKSHAAAKRATHDDMLTRAVKAGNALYLANEAFMDALENKADATHH